VIGPSYGRAESVLWRDCGSEVLVLVLGDDRINVLTGSGALLWDLLGAKSSVPDAAGRIADALGAPVGDVETQIEGFLADLVDRGIAIEVPNDA
jgi:coenzyme PQQ synthesis protein D (PqqD)